MGYRAVGRRLGPSEPVQDRTTRCRTKQIYCLGCRATAVHGEDFGSNLVMVEDCFENCPLSSLFGRSDARSEVQPYLTDPLGLREHAKESAELSRTSCCQACWM